MPRPRETSPPAAGVGALLGAAVGAILAGILSKSPMTLEESLRRALTKRNLRLENLRRETKFELHVLCTDDKGRYQSIVASIPSSDTITPEELDDALYDAVIARIGTPLLPDHVGI